MKLLFIGDIVFNDIKIFPSQKLVALLKKSDYAICNLEGSFVADGAEPIKKAGPHVFNSSLAIDFLKELGVDCAALANNHIMDYGANSFRYTVKILGENGIKTFGAGLSFEEAYRPFIISKDNEKICVINACQAEFGVLKPSANECGELAGYAWINSPNIKSLIKKNLAACDKVVLFVHAGMEDQIIPLPEWKQVFHDFADIINGRGAIILAHPHIVQGYEIYNDTPIFYSLGNFSFYKEELKDNIEWNRGLVVEYDTLTNETKAVPVSIKNNVLDIDDSSGFKNAIDERCALVKDDEKLNALANEIAEKSWNDFYKSYYKSVVNVRGVNSYSSKQLIKLIAKRLLNKIFGARFAVADCDSFDETMLLHNIQIESHRWCVERHLYNKNVKENN